MQTPHTTAAITLAIRAALHAGRDIMRIYTDPRQDFGIERKADNSPLTLADKAAHRRIVEYLAPTDIPILSEEGAHLPYAERQAWQRFWLVDPLDGTKEFIKKNGEFTVNIALVVSQKAHMGVIYVPAQRVLYFADPLIGAYRLDDIVDLPADVRLPELIGRARRLPLEGADARPYTIVASRSHLSAETQQFIDEARLQHPDLVTASSGSSLKLCLVAEGRADVYPRYAPTMEWDTAAGHAIACSAGRGVYRADGEGQLRYNKADLHNPWFIVR